ncbi:ABC transporter ATP-binding protein, partial [Haploplasma axanthum]
TQTGVSEGMRNINLEFNLNEFVAITGESGSGKTTLLNVISGLDSYEDGELYINGLETSHFTVKDFEELRAKNIGFVFQNYNVIDSYTVYQNVVIALEAQGYDPKKKKARALELIEKVGLLSHKNQKTAKLSGGQKQRVVIARALAKNAPIILADEPTGNLDSKSGREIMELLKEISKDKLIILVTHNYEEAKNYITRNIIMSDGNVKEDKVLVKNEKLNEVVDDENNNKTSSIRKSFDIAARNVLSKPKKTIFTFILAVFSLLAVIFTYYGISSSIKLSIGDYSYDPTITYIQKRDDKEFTKSELEEIRKKFENKDLKVTYGVFSKESSADFRMEYSRMGFVAQPLNGLFAKEIEGRLPVKENEVMLSGNYKYSDEYENIYIDLADPEDREKTIKRFKVVGRVLENSMDYNYRQVIYFSDMFIFDENNQVNPIIKQYFTNVNDTNKEIAFYGIDRTEIKHLIRKLDKDIYNIYDPYSIDEAENAITDLVGNIIVFIIMFIIVLIIFLLVYVIQKNMMMSQRKDYAVYRSIGINEKEVKYAILLEQAIISLTATILVLISLSITSIFVRSVRLASRNVGFGGYVFIAAIFIYFSLRQGAKFNRQIFNKTVIGALKEEE